MWNEDNNDTIHTILTVALLITTTFFAATTFYLTNKNPKSVIAPTIQNEEILLTDELTSARYGVISYQYPAGWHVATLWPNEYSQGISLIMHPLPIDSAPRGNQLGKFTITIYNGSNDPTALLAMLKADQTSAKYTNIQTTTLSGKDGLIEYFKGEIAEEYMRSVPVEHYTLTLNQNGTDPLDTQVLHGTFYPEDIQTLAEDSELFRRIMLSFEYGV